VQIGACDGRRHRPQQIAHRLRRVPYERAFVERWGGVDPDDRLIAEVLGHVGDEAILTDGHDDVFRLEQEAVEIAARDAGVTPGGRYGP
jgi:hypothetical protein